jgi:hypothetical protein
MTAWDALLDIVRTTSGIRFQEIEGDFLRAMEALNGQWRAGQIDEGTYRQKGNQWRDLIIELIRTRCSVGLRGRRLQGLTDLHVVDMAYPTEGDPVLAVEAKMLGTPAHLLADGRRKPERGGAVDLDKRLKEVKYTPIDLKLRYTGPDIGHWSEWLKGARPQFYSLWACYLGARELASIAAMIEKFRKLKEHYNDGVGVFFYAQGETEGYVPIHVPELDAFRVDDVVDQICRVFGR